MRVAILEPFREESCNLRDWIADYSKRRAVPVELVWASGQEEFRRKFSPGRFRGAVIACGGVAGFMEVRRAREQDRDCRLVVIDDSPQYAIHCHRLHVADFLIRPVSSARIFLSMDRIFY